MIMDSWFKLYFMISDYRQDFLFWGCMEMGGRVCQCHMYLDDKKYLNTSN